VKCPWESHANGDVANVKKAKWTVKGGKKRSRETPACHQKKVQKKNKASGGDAGGGEGGAGRRGRGEQGACMGEMGRQNTVPGGKGCGGKKKNRMHGGGVAAEEWVRGGKSTTEDSMGVSWAGARGGAREYTM